MESARGGGGTGEGDASAGKGDGARDEGRDSGNGSGDEKTGSGSGGGARGSGPSSPPADVPDGSDDDVVARQIREAAMKETDPELREKLWDEYRRYKKGK